MGAELCSLEVGPLTLQPAFSPTVEDYYVRCAAGENPLTVAATPASGASVSLMGPSTTAPASELKTSVTVVPDQAVVVQATLGAASTSYWVRCLPPDFPPLTMTQHDAGTPPPGFYLVGDTFVGPGDGGYGMLLDVRGTPVWYAKTRNNAGAKDVDMLAPNQFSFISIAAYSFGAYEGSFEVHTVDPVGVSYVNAVNVPIDTHELRRLSNGDYMFFTDPIVTGVDLTGVGMYGIEDILDCELQEVSPTGALVWQWRATDHFDARKETTFAITQPASMSGGKTVNVVDVFHCNSIDWDDSGDLLLSARDMDAIFLISRATGKVLWKMGGTTYNKDGAPHMTLDNDPLHGFLRQHHARFQPDGTISVFDDQSLGPGAARALVMSTDLAAGKASIVWEYDGKNNTLGMGSVVILPDGSRVIGWGADTPDNPPAGATPSPMRNPAFTEVDEQGHDLLDFTFGDDDSTYRAIKIPASEVDLPTLRAAVGAWSSETADAGPH
jgi:hypothetical protein